MKKKINIFEWIFLGIQYAFVAGTVIVTLFLVSAVLAVIGSILYKLLF